MCPRTFLTVQEFLWYNFSAVSGSSAQWLYGGANGDLLQEGLCYMLHDPGLLQLLTHVSAGDTQTLRRQVWLSLWGLWILVSTRFCLSPPSVSDGYGFDSKCNFIPPSVSLGLLLCLCCGVSFFFFFNGIQYSPVDGCSAASCSFGVQELASRVSSVARMPSSTHARWSRSDSAL